MEKQIVFSLFFSHLSVFVHLFVLLVPIIPIGISRKGFLKEFCSIEFLWPHLQARKW